MTMKILLEIVLSLLNLKLTKETCLCMKINLIRPKNIYLFMAEQAGEFLFERHQVTTFYVFLYIS